MVGGPQGEGDDSQRRIRRARGHEGTPAGDIVILEVVGPERQVDDALRWESLFDAGPSHDHIGGSILTVHSTETASGCDSSTRGR